MRHLSSLITVAVVGGLTAAVVNAGDFSGAGAVAVYVTGCAVAALLALTVDPLNKRRAAHHDRS